MMDFFFGKKASEGSVSAMPSEKTKQRTILVIDANPNHNWYQIFADSTDSEGVQVKVEQAAWGDVFATSYSSGRIAVDLRRSVNPIPNSSQRSSRVCFPDMLLVRNGPLELEADHTNLIFAFQYAQLPSVNSLHSIYNTLHRPWVFSQLIAIRNRLGADSFPLIEQIMYSNHREMLATPQYPIVLKVGHAHAGYGKVRVRDHHDFEDLRGLVALHGDYSTTEPFLQGEFDLRIQKIGDQYRVFKRTGSGTNWKTNTGSSVLEELDVTPKYKLWADECSRMFGGLDILAVDAIHTKDGKEFILEMNDGSIGLAPEREDADNKAIRNLVITRLREAYPAKTKH